MTLLGVQCMAAGSGGQVMLLDLFQQGVFTGKQMQCSDVCPCIIDIAGVK